MFTEISLPEQIEEAKRVIALRQAQMLMAAMHRDAAEIDREEWDGFAFRYASAVRELQTLHQIVMNGTEAITKTTRGVTWVQR